MLDRRGDACGLQFSDMGQGMLADAVGGGPKAAGGHDGRAEERVDVDDGREGPVDPGGPGFRRHDPGDGGGSLNVVDRRKGEGVRHLGPEGGTHPAALKIGGDEIGDVGRPAESVQRVQFRRGIGAEELGDPGGGEGGDAVGHFGAGPEADVDEQLPDLRGPVHPGKRGADPVPGWCVQGEGRGGKDLIDLGHRTALSGLLRRDFARDRRKDRLGHFG